MSDRKNIIEGMPAKALATLLILGTSALSLKAQDYESSFRLWNEGRLTLKEIPVREMWSMDNDVSTFSFEVRPSIKKERYGNLRYRRCVTDTYIDKMNSWIKTGYDTPATLKYMQVGFDIVEATRRRLQNELDQSSAGYNDLISFYKNVTDNALNEYKAATKKGADTAAVNSYSERISRILEKDVPKDEEPIISFRKFGAGVRFGFGSEFFVGEAADYIPSLYSMLMGFEVSVSRFRFNLDMQYGFGGAYKKDIPYTKANPVHNWSKGEKSEGGSITQSFSYAVVDNKRIVLSPMFGIGAGFLDRKDRYLPGNADEGRHEEIAGFRMLAGVDFDWKMARYLSNNPFLGKDYWESDLRFMVYAAKTWLGSPCDTWSINVGVAYNFYGRFIK